MDKTNEMPKTVLDFFTGSGGINIDAVTAEKLLTKIVESLLAMGHRVIDLEDGCRISTAIMNEHYIEIPVDYARSFFERYVQEARSMASGRKRKRVREVNDET